MSKGRLKSLQQISLVQTFKAQPHHTGWIPKELDRDALVKVKLHTPMKHRLKRGEKFTKALLHCRPAKIS